MRGTTTTTTSSDEVKHAASVAISPTTTNQDLKSAPKFKNAFRATSLRREFKKHDALYAVVTERPDFFAQDYDDDPTKFAGKIVALSEDLVTDAGGAEKGTDAAATATAAAADDDGDADDEFMVTDASKGLISAIMAAISSNCHLVLRPDDVWLTILSQFCAYVNKNAAGLRSRIVEHEGQEELKVESYGSLETANHERMIRDLLVEIRKNIKSPELTDWFRPGFSTTTERDEVCAAATAMASLKACFSCTWSAEGGIPSVTLLGTVADWKLLREKVDRLLEFEVEGNPEGNVMELWVGYLRKACDGFVESSEHPGSDKTLEFWDNVISCVPYGFYGLWMERITGWLSAFTCFDTDGNFVASRIYDDADFPLINQKNICHNVVSCPVKIDDDGKVHDGTLFVGQVVFEVRQGRGEEYPTVRPRNDWCMAVATKTWFLRLDNIGEMQREEQMHRRPRVARTFAT